MKVELSSGGLLIVPETDFEECYLDELVPRGENTKFEGFIKTGLTPADKLGLKLVRREEK